MYTNLVLLTVTNYTDTFLLYLQSASIVAFWKGEKKYVIVIEDRTLIKINQTIDYINKNIRPFFDNKWEVIVLVGKSTSTDSGWHRQQLLKLHYSAMINNEWVLLLDTKNFFIREVTATNFFVKGAPIMNTYPGNHAFGLRCNSNMRKYLDLTPEVTDNFSLLTPALFHTATLRNLLIDINFDVNKWKFGEATEISLYLNYATQFLKYIPCDFITGIYDNDINGSDLAQAEMIEYAVRREYILFWSHHRRAFSETTINITSEVMNKVGIKSEIINNWKDNYINTVTENPSIISY
jgi:hypothetical protein